LSGVFDFLLNAELEKEDDEEDEDYVEEKNDNEEEEDDEDEDEDDDDDDDEDEDEEHEEKEASDDDNPEVAEEKILIKNGIVKDSVTYMVMDDLVIHPLFSAISMIDLLNSKFNIKDITALQEKVVEFGVNEVS
jgi:hypothetical protein